MNIPIIRRLLWVMNEIIDSTPNGGITRQALSDKWEDSCKNDKPGSPIRERTFYRILDGIKELFGCELICNPTTKKYTIQLEDETFQDSESPLLKILMHNAGNASINEILQMIVAGNDIPLNDMRAARDLSVAVSRLPQKNAEKFLGEAVGINGADRAEEDEYYSNYVCVWNEAVYGRTSQWLSIGFYDDEVCFYVVTHESDPAERERKATEAKVAEGIRYRGGYYWHEPVEKELFTMSFETKPDMSKVKKRVELLLERLANVHPNAESLPTD